ncbi:hypothetical protein K1T71_006532 [Dendrolimus kikuchii]|uniref:Uncharacterized protein n=1 Tax=Dendrolimus kikuchii TaxID=765133 RepID=A0ACC1D115_9NEOP|nr:hypothetical protein K1T71_006532 [Dendrolimus kikuchii]
MSGGRTCLLFNGYTFFYRYKCRMGRKWCCTLFPKCKSHLYLDENNDILQISEFHEHVRNYLHKLNFYFSAQLITMVTGKQVLEYQGYTYYVQQKLKKNSRWVCTTYPNCKAYVRTNNNLYVVEKDTNHSHTKKVLYKTKTGLYTRL